MLPECIAVLTKHSVLLCVNHSGENNTRLTLKQQLMLTGENQTLCAREPEESMIKTDGSDS